MLCNIHVRSCETFYLITFMFDMNCTAQSNGKHLQLTLFYTKSCHPGTYIFQKLNHTW